MFSSTGPGAANAVGRLDRGAVRRLAGAAHHRPDRDEIRRSRVSARCMTHTISSACCGSVCKAAYQAAVGAAGDGRADPAAVTQALTRAHGPGQRRRSRSICNACRSRGRPCWTISCCRSRRRARLRAPKWTNSPRVSNAAKRPMLWVGSGARARRRGNPQVARYRLHRGQQHQRQGTVPEDDPLSLGGSARQRHAGSAGVLRDRAICCWWSAPGCAGTKPATSP